MRNPNQKQRDQFIVWAVLLPFVMWAAALIAQSITPGVKLDGLLDNLTKSFSHPFTLQRTERTAAFIFSAVLLYVLCIAYYYAAKGKTRPGEEHGSAAWANPKQINGKYRDHKNADRNIILTEHVSLGMDTHRHRRNLNVLVCGGSGAGKSRFYCKPNLMNADGSCSYICTDPKGELLRDCAPLLEAQGYDIRVLNLVDMERSHCYNPFVYMQDDKDVLKLVNNLIQNTTPKNAKADDPFWVKSETALITALVLFLKHFAPPYEQNFPMVMYLIENAGASEDSEEYKSPVDSLFDELEETHPDHIALKEYKVFKQAAGKTAKSILVSAAVRLQVFLLPQFAAITERDELDIGSMAEGKRALFCVIPDNDASFTFIVGMVLTQAIQTLYYRADHIHHGPLPRHVRFIADEFPNLAIPTQDFGRWISTCRSRSIGLEIIIQNFVQLKEMFDKGWENIVGNCDTFLYLGGNEQSTHEYVSKLLGKATIDTKTRGINKGRNGSTSENFQNAGRELLTPDEVRKLDNELALLFIRGEAAVCDNKYRLERHPRIALTVDGGARPYIVPRDYSRADLSVDISDWDNIIIE